MGIEKLVVDASVLLACFFGETNNPEITTILEKIVAGKIEAHVPDFQRYEIASVLRKRCVAQSGARISTAEAEEIFAEYAELPLVQHPTDNEATARAMKSAVELGTGFYDAAQLHLADEQSLFWLTCDKELHESGKRGGGIRQDTRLVLRLRFEPQRVVAR